MISRQLLLIDAHCHNYPCFSTYGLISAAQNNFTARSKAMDVTSQYSACLMLADLQWGGMQKRVNELRAELSDNSIHVHDTDEPWSFNITQKSKQTITAILGYQLITREKIEVLIYGLSSELPPDLPLQQVLQHAREQNALAIVPWGFGKWLGKRGQVVKHWLDSTTKTEGNGFVADNGGRWRRSKTPELLRYAGAREIWNLPGSDPLPFSSEIQRAGATGFILDVEINDQKMLATIQKHLNNPKEQPEIYGTGERLLRVANHQIRMQLRKYNSNPSNS